MPMEKKKWSEPMLVELVRGAPEEAVLAFCRIGKPGTSTPQDLGYGCICPTAAACTVCKELTAS